MVVNIGNRIKSEGIIKEDIINCNNHVVSGDQSRLIKKS